MSESVGELINITVDVYHRHLTESWYLRDVEVYDENLRKLWSFPCYEVVEGSITLEPGDGDDNSSSTKKWPTIAYIFGAV